MKAASEWGSWDVDTFTFTGKEISRNAENGQITVKMRRFIEEAEVRMPRYRGRLEERLTATEMTEFRSAIGCLQWLAGSARPDLAAETSLLQGPEPKVKRPCGRPEGVQAREAHEGSRDSNPAVPLGKVGTVRLLRCIMGERSRRKDTGSTPGDRRFCRCPEARDTGQHP